MRVMETCLVTPSGGAAGVISSQPLTFFDTFWLKMPPAELILYYRHPNDEVSAAAAARLKRSLSVALSRFLPLAGKLTWPADAEVPFLLYTPGDGVSFTVAADSDADFDLLSGDAPRAARLSHACLPALAVSGPNAAAFAVKVTLLRRGLCVGITFHHAVMDGRSAGMFYKAWAHVSKFDAVDGGGLPEDLTPFLDRTVVMDPDGIALDDARAWMNIRAPSLLEDEEDDYNPRNLELLSEHDPSIISSNQVRATFRLTRQDINKLKKNVLHQLNPQVTKLSELSTFVVTFAYVLVCMAKAKGLDDDKTVIFGFPPDCRSRLDPPLPSNYFGNGILLFLAPAMKIGDLVHGVGLARVARAVIEVIKVLDQNFLVGAKGKLRRLFEAPQEEGLIGVGVAGSPRLGLYGVDFGFGRPEKVEFTSIDRTSAMSMAESGDGSGGVEVGIVMLKHEIDKFTSSFLDGHKARRAAL